MNSVDTIGLDSFIGASALSDIVTKHSRSLFTGNRRSPTIAYASTNDSRAVDLFGRMSTLFPYMSAEDYPNSKANAKRLLQERVLSIKNALQRKEITPDQARVLLEAIRTELEKTEDPSDS